MNRLGVQSELADDDLRELMTSYVGWEGRTRRDHRALVLCWLSRLGWRTPGAGGRKQLDAPYCAGAARQRRARRVAAPSPVSSLGRGERP